MMTFFERILNFGSSNDVGQPDIPFGRYTDVYKSVEQYDAWDKSIELFEKDQHLEAYRAFFNYLTDTKEKNVSWTEENGTITFEIQQGSKAIKGFANIEKVRAESHIAKADMTNVGFMRRLMEHNFSLKYSRFALTPENHIVILFDTLVSDGSPLKLYHALKEMSINADKQDDLLLDEFKMLHPIADAMLGETIAEQEKEIKYNYIQHEIKKVFDEFDKGKPDTNQYPGGYAYAFLYLAYKLDYLVKPEGFMMETLEKIHRSYFAAHEERTAQIKNMVIRKEFQKLIDRPKEAFFKEMYRTKSTFGITTPVNHDRIAALIEGELPNMDWYKDNNHPMLALCIPGYIVGYALFNYALPKPDKDFFHLYLQIMEAGYFRDLGFKLPYYDANGKPDKKAILKGIKEIAERNKESYPKLAPDLKMLDFSSPVLFAKTYMEMIKELNLVKAD